MPFSWPTAELTVSERIGVATETPSTELDVIGSIAAINLTLTGNLELGALSINEFSTDGNLSDNSNLAVPTEQAVKTYVDGQITQINNTRAALNGANNQDFAAQNLSVTQNLSVLGNLEVQGDVIARDTQHTSGDVSLGDDDSDRITITGVVNSGHSSGALPINAPLEVRGALKLAGSDSLLFHNTNESGNPTGDGFRLRYDGHFFGTNLDALVVEKTDGNGANPDGGIAFVNTGNDGIVATALTIRGNGYIGMGTPQPNRALTIQGSAGTYLNVKGDGGTHEVLVGADGSGGIVSTMTNHDLQLRAGGNSTKMTIKANGSVGIGTTTPSSGAKLDVHGNLYVGGQAAIASNNYWHRAQSNSDTHYGYFEVRRPSNNRRGCYLGWGKPGEYVDLRLEEGNDLAITGGRVGIGTNSPKSTQHIVGDLVLGKDVNNQKFIFHSRTNGNGDFLQIACDNTSGGWDWNKGILFFRNGDIKIRGRLFVNNIPYGDKRNMQWDSSTGLFYYDNSSRKTKENITSLEDDFTKILQVAPKTYTRPGDAKNWEIGYIAEEFDELGLNSLVYYDDDGSPGGINYRKISLYLVEVVKKLEQKLHTYENRLQQLENTVE